MGLVKDIESYLTDKFSRKYCIFTGSGTTALYLLLKTLKLKEGDTVLLPGICCFSVAYAVKYAGLKLDFCDVSINDACLSTDALEASIKHNPSIKVVIGVHLYGNVLDMDSIMKICKKHRIVFIEDVCQAYGSYYKNRPCGSFGDYSILSFGHTKILDNGHGGAVLTDNSQDVEMIRNKSGKLINYDKQEHDRLSSNHSDRYYKLQALSRNNPAKIVLFEKLLKGFMENFIHGIDYSSLKRLKILLKKEHKIIAHRIKLYKLYKTTLRENSSIGLIGSDHKIVPWRFSFLIPYVNTLRLCDMLRNEGFDISTWYPNLANMFVSDNRRKLKNANIIESSVVNCWVDDTKNEKDVLNICSRILELNNDKRYQIGTNKYIA